MTLIGRIIVYQDDQTVAEVATFVTIRMAILPGKDVENVVRTSMVYIFMATLVVDMPDSGDELHVFV